MHAGSGATFLSLSPSLSLSLPSPEIVHSKMKVKSARGNETISRIRASTSRLGVEDCYRIS